MLTLVFLAGAYLCIQIALALIGWKGIAAVGFVLLFAALLSLASSTQERH